MLIVMETHRKPRVQDETRVKTLIPDFSTGNFLQNLEYQLRMIHLADTAEQVRFFASCDLERYFRGNGISAGSAERHYLSGRCGFGLHGDRQRRGNLHHKKSVCLRRQGGGKRSL